MSIRKGKKYASDRKIQETAPEHATINTTTIHSNNLPPPVHFTPTSPPATKPTKKPAITVPKLSERLLSLRVDHNFDWENLSLNMQTPELHQLVMSWCWCPSPLDALTEVFGTAKETKGKKGYVRGYEFANGLYLRKRPAHNTFWYTIRFNADNEILAGLDRVAKTDSVLWKRIRRVQVKSAEIAQNIPCPGKSYKEVEKLMLAMLSVATPAEPSTVLKVMRDTKKSDPEKKGKGRITAYFKKVRNDSGNIVFVKEQPHEIKIYLKKILGVWNVRIEVKISKGHLKPYDVLPISVSPSWIAKFPLGKYLTFAKIERKKYAKELWKRLHPQNVEQGKHYKTVHSDYARWTATRTLPAAEQNYFMHMLGKSTAVRLRQGVKQGKFKENIDPFEK